MDIFLLNVKRISLVIHPVVKEVAGRNKNPPTSYRRGIENMFRMDFYKRD
jgi:hypothetical protein